MSGPLANRRIALAECRELDLLARMLEREGAESLRCPLVAIRDAADAAPVEAWIRRVIAGECDDLILYTGEGVRRLVGFAERAGLSDEFVAALGRVNKITRGPKPVRALREIGLSPDLAAEVPTTDGIIAALEGKTLHARAVGVQLYGQEPKCGHARNWRQADRTRAATDCRYAVGDFRAGGSRWRSHARQCELLTRRLTARRIRRCR